MGKIIYNWLASLCLAIITFTACVNESEPEGANIQVGDKLPDLAINLNDGTQVTNQSLQGEVSLILLFTVTCPDCQAQLPIVERIYNEYKSDDNFILFAISREQGESVVEPYWSENGLTLPYSAQESRYVYSLFASSVVPRIYISDENRIVRTITTDNPIASYQTLKTAIDALLNGY